MSKNLVISTAVLAAAIATAACEKIPSGETNQSGSVRTEAAEQAKRQQAEPQERSDQTPNQATPGETRQASNPSQTSTGRTEQASKSTQSSPGQSERASKPNQGEPRRTEHENSPAQAAPGGTDQASKSAQAVPAGNEQANKSTQPAPAQTQQANNSTNAVPGGTEQQSERGRQQAAEASDSSAERNTHGQPSQQDRTTVQSDGGTPAQSAAQFNEPQQDQAQLNAQTNRAEQNQEAEGNTNLSPDQASTSILRFESYQAALSSL
jgi:hypothetical protein